MHGKQLVMQWPIRNEEYIVLPGLKIEDSQIMGRNMNKLIKYEEVTTEQGFTFQKGWWGEFPHTGELVKVYAYPFTHINDWDWTYTWSTCRVFYKFANGFVRIWSHIDKVPNEVAEHFWEVAEQEMLDRREDMEKGVE